jgi:hypothetical protein
MRGTAAAGHHHQGTTNLLLACYQPPIRSRSWRGTGPIESSERDAWSSRALYYEITDPLRAPATDMCLAAWPPAGQRRS